MQVTSTLLPDVKLLRPARHADARGFFSETYNRAVAAAAGITVEFVQDNHSLSRPAGVVRGLHFQIAPMAQAKLLRVLRGAILDVAVDIRVGSPTWGRHVAVKLRADDGDQLYVPPGFAHGFCTLTSDTEVLYKVSAYYSPEHDRGLLWNDPALGIDWPVQAAAAIVSPRDQRHPKLADLPHYFSYRSGDSTARQAVLAQVG